METTRIQIKTLIVICSGVILIEWLRHLIHVASGRIELLVLAGVRSFEIIFIVIAVRFFEFSIKPIGLPSSQFRIGVKRGVIWSIGFGCISGIGFLVLYLLGLNPLLMVRVKLPSNIIDTALFFIVGGLISPVAEEFVFRGVIYSFFRQWGFFPAILMSTFLFVSLHSTGGVLPIPQLVGGILFATAFELEKNLMTPIIVHILGNLAIFSLSLLATI